MLASTIKNSLPHLPLIAQKITTKQISTQDQVTGIFNVKFKLQSSFVTKRWKSMKLNLIHTVVLVKYFLI